MTTTPDLGPLYTALLAAQMDSKRIAHDGRVTFGGGYSYTSTEAIMAHGTAVLGRHGLAFLPTASSLQATGEQKPPFVLVRSWLLIHPESGGTLAMTQDWPVVPGKGRDLDKAVAAADTASYGYVLRDMLMLPRVEKGTDLNDMYQDSDLSAPERQSQHDPSWEGDRAAFCAALADLGCTYDGVKTMCAGIDRPKPSRMTRDQRSALLGWLQNDDGIAKYNSFADASE